MSERKTRAEPGTILIGGSTIRQTPLDWVGNRARIEQVLRTGRECGVAVLCLPELAISGYGCDDFFLHAETTRRAAESLEALLVHTLGITAILGFPHQHAGALYNCAAVVQNGVILGMRAKTALARDGIHYEPRWFQAWPSGVQDMTRISDREVPIGDVWFQLGEVGVALEICEEAWIAPSAAEKFAGHVSLVVNPSASHFAIGKLETRRRLVASLSKKLICSYVYSNHVGCEAGRAIYDGGVLIARQGTILAEGRRFGFVDGDLTVATVSLKASAATIAVSAESVPPPIRGEDPRVIASTGRGPRATPAAPAPSAVTVTPQPAEKLAPSYDAHSEFLLAVTQGLFDYLRKARARGFVVSLSGGCDSAACAVLIAHTVGLALAEIGPVRLAEAWGLGSCQGEFAEKLQASADPRVWLRQLLCTVYQATTNSGELTQTLARNLAEEIGATHYDVNVGKLVSEYESLFEQTTGQSLTWERDDLVKQNIQARVRAPFAWMLANARQALLITTSNRSEAAVGYATMDGDLAGGLAPLAGIDKAFLRRWLKWASEQTALGIGPVAALAQIAALAPTAELRPPEAEQTDEGDLMPYDILARIEQLLLRDRLAVDEVKVALAREFPAESSRLAKYVDTFLRLFTQSQWKRERMAPGFHIDSFSLDPKTWARYPIFFKT